MEEFVLYRGRLEGVNVGLKRRDDAFTVLEGN